MKNNLNSLHFWYPQIEGIVPTPKTTIITTDLDLCPLLDGKDVPGATDLVNQLEAAAEAMGFPCFLRTGLTSGKHEWLDTCFIDRKGVLGRHMMALIEYSEMADMIGLPYKVWVVREMLPTKPIGTIYQGMPVCREFRAFVSDAKLLCIHPYWPEGVFKGNVPEGYNEMCRIDDSTRAWVGALARQAGKAVGGAWSVDCLETERGWFVTDMAVMEDSWHWPDCPNAEG